MMLYPVRRRCEVCGEKATVFADHTWMCMKHALEAIYKKASEKEIRRAIEKHLDTPDRSSK
jgi:hypothetical protein